MVFDLFTVSLWLAAFSLVGGAAWFGYLRFERRGLGKVIRIFLFELIGQDKVFRYLTTGYEKVDDELGVYIVVGKAKTPISDISNQDFFADKKFGKCLMVCKYADDDFRPMTRLSGDNWFRKELVQRPVVDKKGEPVFESVEVDGESVDKPVLESVEEFVSYVEPLGVGQDAREAMRFNRAHARRMQSLRGEQNNWWDKYGTYVMSAFMLIMMLMIVVYVTNKNNEAVMYITDRWSEQAGSIVAPEATKGYAEKLFTEWEQRNANAAAPPS